MIRFGKKMVRLAAVLAFFPVWNTSAEPVQKPERAFWVERRDRALSEIERSELKQQGIFTLYWHAAEVETVNGPWRFSRWPSTPQKSDIEIRVVPVIRIKSTDRDPLSSEYIDMLVDRIAEVARRAGADEVQLDWSPPDRMLGQYAAALKLVREKVKRLSITARPEWIRNPAFGELDAATDEIIPRFFEETAFLPLGVPLLDLEACRKEIEAWKGSGTQWRMGLPAFTRVTVYDIAGRPRTELRSWKWDDLIFHDALRLSGEPQNGITKLHVTSRTTISYEAVEQDDNLVVRSPVAAVLAEMERLSGVGSVYERLPAGATDTTWSIRQVGSVGAPQEKPRLKVLVGNGLTLVNDSAFDLTPNLKDRGYAIQIQAPGPIFREVREGDFARFVAEGNPDSSRRKTAEDERARELMLSSVSLASRLTFWFSGLPAGASLQARPLQLNPGSNIEELSYRFLNLPEKSDWQPLKSTDE